MNHIYVEFQHVRPARCVQLAGLVPVFPVASWEDFSEYWFVRGSSVTAKGKPHFPFFALGLSWWDLPENWQKRILFMFACHPKGAWISLLVVTSGNVTHETCNHKSLVCITDNTAGQWQILTPVLLLFPSDLSKWWCGTGEIAVPQDSLEIIQNSLCNSFSSVFLSPRLCDR